MKKLCISLFLFSCMVVAENTKEHTYFRPVFSPAPKENLKWHMSKYGRYVNKKSSVFEKEEMALLFGQIICDVNPDFAPEIFRSFVDPRISSSPRFNANPWARIFKHVEQV